MRRWLLFCSLSLVASPVAANVQQSEYTIHGTDIKVEVHSQQKAGELADQCNFDATSPGPPAFICVGCLSGAEDGLRIAWAANALPIAFCPPVGAPRSVLLKTFVEFVRKHPEKRDLPAALVVLQAYREAYPCAASTKQ